MAEPTGPATGPLHGPFPRLRLLWEAVPLPRRDGSARVPFDLLFGAAVPILLLHLDLHWLPTLDLGVGPVLPFRPYSPVATYAFILSLLAWYPFRRREGWLHGAASGLLLLGAAFAAGIAAVLLPLSIIGMMATGIGLLGLLPFPTALVFADAGFRAFATARRRLPTGPVVALALLSAAVLGGASLAAGRVVRILEFRYTEVLIGERTGSAADAERNLRVLHWFPGVSLVRLAASGRERRTDGSRVRPEAAKAWERITGRELRRPSDD